MFITALFKIVRIWKQLRCSLINELIKKSVHIVEYYSNMKKNEFESVVVR